VATLVEALRAIERVDAFATLKNDANRSRRTRECYDSIRFFFAKAPVRRLRSRGHLEYDNFGTVLR